MLSVDEIKKGLAGFHGSEKIHKITIAAPRMMATDGVVWLCKNAQCFWLIDVIGSYQRQMIKQQRTKEFQAWEMKVDLEKKTAVVVGMDDMTPVIKQEIDLTDFPLESIKFYVEQSGENQWVVMLPSER